MSYEEENALDEAVEGGSTSDDAHPVREDVRDETRSAEDGHLSMSLKVRLL